MSDETIEQDLEADDDGSIEPSDEPEPDDLPDDDDQVLEPG